MVSGNVAGQAPPTGPFTELAHELARQARLAHILKSQLTSTAPSGLDGAALLLLLHLVKCGPRRQSDLAGVALLDPSTVSRHASQLVKAGLARRQPDPGDGRAVQLAATDSGRQAAADLRARHSEFLMSALTEWNDADALALLDLLRRLNDGLERRLSDAPSPASPDA